MPNFQYQAINANGKQETGFLEADTKERGQDILIQRNLVPVSLSETKSRDQTPWWSRDIIALGPPVKPREIVTFFQTLATMLEAQLPMKSVLEYTAKQTTSKPLRQALESVIDDVQNGKTLTTALEKSPQIFAQRYVTILKIGERSNAHTVAANQCAEMIRSEQEMKSEIHAALIYPAILLVMSMVVIGIVLFHLTPTLAPVFAQAGAELPTSMRIMLAIRDTILALWPIILVGQGVVIILLIALFRARPVFVENILLHFPFIGPIFQDRENQRFSNTMFLMLKSGAGLPEALDMAVSATNWRQYSTLFRETLTTVNAGGTLSENLKNSSLISPLLKNMLSVGEKTDKLVPLLKTTADILHKSHQEALQTAIKMLTPALTLLIGLGVGGMIFSTMTAIMDINDVVF
ncbi:MAG: type II secretion system F family protein [Paracoccaceae bacterium]